MLIIFFPLLLWIPSKHRTKLKELFIWIAKSGRTQYHKQTNKQTNCTWLFISNCNNASDIFISSRPEVFLRKGVLKIRSKFTGEHPCQSAIWIKLLCNFIEIALHHQCSPVNLLHIFRTAFPRNTSGWLLLHFGLNVFLHYFWLHEFI